MAINSNQAIITNEGNLIAYEINEISNAPLPFQDGGMLLPIYRSNNNTVISVNEIIEDDTLDSVKYNKGTSGNSANNILKAKEFIEGPIDVLPPIVTYNNSTRGKITSISINNPNPFQCTLHYALSESTTVSPSYQTTTLAAGASISWSNLSTGRRVECWLSADTDIPYTNSYILNSTVSDDVTQDVVLTYATPTIGICTTKGYGAWMQARSPLTNLATVNVKIYVGTAGRTVQGATVHPTWNNTYVASGNVNTGGYVYYEGDVSTTVNNVRVLYYYRAKAWPIQGRDTTLNVASDYISDPGYHPSALSTPSITGSSGTDDFYNSAKITVTNNSSVTCDIRAVDVTPEAGQDDSYTFENVAAGASQSIGGGHNYNIGSGAWYAYAVAPGYKRSSDSSTVGPFYNYGSASAS